MGGGGGGAGGGCFGDVLGMKEAVAAAKAERSASSVGFDGVRPYSVVTVVFCFASSFLRPDHDSLSALVRLYGFSSD